MDASAAKLIGAGLATIALAGVGVGIGNIFGRLRLAARCATRKRAPRVFGNVLAGLRAHRGRRAVRAGHRLHDPVRVLQPASSQRSCVNRSTARSAAASSVRVAGGAGQRQAACRSSTVHDFAPQLGLAGDRVRGAVPGDVGLAVPRIEDTLAKRQGKIQGDLDAAEKANEETRAWSTLTSKRLADAREEARRVQREQAEADSAAATARFDRTRRRSAAKQIDEAEKRIAGQRDDVMAGLEHMAERYRPGASMPSSPASRRTTARSPAKVAAAQGRRPMIGTAWAAGRREGTTAASSPIRHSGSRSPSSCSSPRRQDPVDPRSPPCSTSAPPISPGAGRSRAPA